MVTTVSGRRRQDGLTYLGVLLAVAILGTALAATGTVWRTARRHGNERELLFVGNEFRRAIEAYYVHTPGPAKQYPPSLEALLQDQRYPSVQRYLRRVYRDPITDRAEWGLVRAPEGGIAGIFSLSEAAPLKRANFSKKDEGFAGTTKYSDWRFVFMPAAAQAPASGAAPGMSLGTPPPTAAPPQPGAGPVPPPSAIGG